ncbi:hypothetical protein VIGAN_05142100, partial [Vigna angularis var. angularis]
FPNLISLPCSPFLLKSSLDPFPCTPSFTCKLKNPNLQNLRSLISTTAPPYLIFYFLRSLFKASSSIDCRSHRRQ